MSVIIIPRKHLTQPQGRVELAPEWAGALRGAFRFSGASWADDVTRRLYAGTDTAYRSTGSGLAGNFNGSSSGVNLGNRSDLFAGTAFSVELLLVADAASVGGATRKQLFSKDAASGREVNVQLGNDSGSTAGGLWFGFFNGGQVTLVGQGSGQGVVAGVVSHLCFVCSPSAGADGISMWLNGTRVPQYTVASQAVAVGATSTDLHIGRRVYSGYEEPFAGAIHAVWCHGRALSAAEIVDRAHAPWNLYRAYPIRIYSLPSGPISISWSSLTASNITQTGARLTIGGITR